MSQHLDTLKICKRNNGRPFKKVFFQHRDNNTVAEKQLQQQKHCKKQCFSVVGLENVLYREGNCQGNQNYELAQFNTLLERFYAEIKNKHG